MIPKGWKKVFLGNEIKLLKGSLVKTFYQQQEKGMVPYLLINSFNGLDLKYVNPEKFNICRKEDSVLVMDGSRSGLVLRGKSGVIGSTLAAVLPNKPNCLDKNYLYCILTSLYKFLNHGKTKGAVPHVDRRALLDLPVYLPPFPEQRKIAAILSSVDEAIEKTKAVIEQTKIVKKGLMQELLALGIPGRHKKFKKTAVGEIPEEWEVVKLGDIAKVQTGIAKNSKKKKENPITLPYLRVANVQDGFVDLSEIKHIVIDKNKAERYLLQKGDVLFNEGGDNDKLGRGCVWEAKTNPCAHQNHVFAVRCYSKISPYYLAFFAASTIGKQFFLTAAKQTTNLASINSSQLKLFPISLPSPEEQHKIINIIRSIDNNISAKQELLDSMQNMKSALMQVLLTGEERVTV